MTRFMNQFSFSLFADEKLENSNQLPESNKAVPVFVGKVCCEKRKNLIFRFQFRFSHHLSISDKKDLDV